MVSNCIGEISNPVVYNMKLKAANSKKYKVRFNLHDHDDIHFSLYIVNQLNYLEQEKPIICEMRSGYGSLASNIKIKLKVQNNYFDIPKVNAVHSYYLLNTILDQGIFGYQDFLKYGSKIFDEDFDFFNYASIGCK